MLEIPAKLRDRICKKIDEKGLFLSLISLRQNKMRGEMPDRRKKHVINSPRLSSALCTDV